MDTQQLADRIWVAVQSTTPISPLTDTNPELTVDAAYAIQEDILERHTRTGATIAAAKLGLTSRAKQQQMNVSEPLYGWLTDAMRVEGKAVADDYIQPRAEPEIAFMLSEELAGPDITTAQVIAATEVSRKGQCTIRRKLAHSDGSFSRFGSLNRVEQGVIIGICNHCYVNISFVV